VSKDNENIKALVLNAIKVAARHAFFNTNEYISKRLVPGQYHQYPQMASVSFADIHKHVNTSIKKAEITYSITKLVSDGVLAKKKRGKINLYWLPVTDYLLK
jgi:hypothetical protein